jgi:hypothetical protein
MDEVEIRFANNNKISHMTRDAQVEVYILLASGADAVLCPLVSFGGVLSPSTSSSSAFRFADPLEYDFSMTGARIDREGIVGVDLW